MSLLLQNCSGVVHVFGNGAGIGMFKLSPAIPSAPPQSMCFIDSIPASAREVVQPIVTLDDSRFLYVFGGAWTEATITGRLILGQSGGMGMQMKRLSDWYQANRVGKRRSYTGASAGMLPIKAYVTGLQIGEVDPNTYVQRFNISALVNLDV